MLTCHACKQTPSFAPQQCSGSHVRFFVGKTGASWLESERLQTAAAAAPLADATAASPQAHLQRATGRTARSAARLVAPSRRGTGCSDAAARPAGADNPVRCLRKCVMFLEPRRRRACAHAVDRRAAYHSQHCGAHATAVACRLLRAHSRRRQHCHRSRPRFSSATRRNKPAASYALVARSATPRPRRCGAEARLASAAFSDVSACLRRTCHGCAPLVICATRRK